MPLSRYITENWVPRKLDLAISVPLEDLSLASSVYDPSTAGEPIPDEIKVAVNEAAIQQLAEMGFSTNKAIQALEQTGNQGAEAAMEWLLQHLETPELEYSGAASEDPTAGLDIPEESVSILAGAGYSVAQARRALAEAGLDVNAAYEALLTHPDASAGTLSFSRKAPPTASSAAPGDTGSTAYDLEAFICHKGPSIHCGHYVAYRRDAGRRWVLCNDEKLAWTSEEMAQEAAAKAYIFFYKRRPL
jgi:ubiquitin carboxyl-terminal hydrolase 5/13